MMRNYFLLFLVLSGTMYGQENVPKDYFANPLEIPIILSGSFGELRGNHFHSGLDIKTQQRRGIPIYAPADGYVKRIKVAHYGYGKALYIQHPNGYSTVYAHLQKYADNIQTYVKDKQYVKETYTIELHPEASELPVNKGDLIGYTGNSGSSGGPHLHYEIRDAASRPMNPLLFGVKIPDTKDPLVTAIFAYPIGKEAQINGSQDPVKLRLIKQKDGTYKVENCLAFGKIGFGISSIDQQDGASNKNGVYQIKTSFNGTEKFKVLFEKFSFAETRYLNRYIDYGYYKTNRSRIQKLFRQSNNPLSIIKNESDNGYIEVTEGYKSVYKIEITDYAKNKISISIPIEGKQQEITQSRSVVATDDFIYGDQGTSITKGKFGVYIPANSLYENAYLDIELAGDTLHLHKDVIPLHKNMTIHVDVSTYDDADIGQLYIGRLNYAGKPYYTKTTRKGSKLSARSRTFGSYLLVSDTTVPTIHPVNFSEEKWISKENILQVKIEDDLSGISSYRATINGKFILMEYNYKTDVLTYDFDDQINLEPKNNLKVIVIDNVGNNATFETTFFRKNT